MSTIFPIFYYSKKFPSNSVTPKHNCEYYLFIPCTTMVCIYIYNLSMSTYVRISPCTNIVCLYMIYVCPPRWPYDHIPPTYNLLHSNERTLEKNWLYISVYCVFGV